MSMPISQADAAELFGLPTKVLYVCDGKKECGKPYCLDHSNDHVCHHTADYAHALYDIHYMSQFGRYPTVRNGEAAIICVEPIRG